VIVDAHHHLWDPDVGTYDWMTGGYAPLRRLYGVDDLVRAIGQTGVEVTVVVQVRHDVLETFELLALAGPDRPVRGVVGWLDLTEPDRITDQVEAFRSSPNGSALVGIRHLVQDEPDPEWLLRQSVQESLDTLGRLGLAYDLVIRPAQLAASVETARAHPTTRFVLDHIAKPRMAAGATDPEWERFMPSLAELPNVWCKLSGLVTEADWVHWAIDDIRPYADRIYDWFGEDRLLFGSDWPVCEVAATYGQVFDLVGELLAGVTETARAKIMGENATAVYRIATGEAILADRATTGGCVRLRSVDLGNDSSG
jgi:L-fuconolactonase